MHLRRPLFSARLFTARPSLVLLAHAAAIISCGGGDSTEPNPLPTISSVSPASGPLAGSTNITITGTNFDNVTEVTIGGLAITNLMVSSTTQLQGRTAAGMSAGPTDVMVTSSSNGDATCTGCFTYNPAVTVTSVSPSNGPLAAGSVVTITGTNFVNVGLVTIGGMSLTNFNVVSPTEITGTLPAGQGPGAKQVTVGSSTHGTGSCTGCYTYNPNLTISMVSVREGPLAGRTIAIYGTNFAAGMSVTVGGVPVTSLVIISSTHITVTTPPSGTTGARDITVSRPMFGSATCTACFTYNPPAVITSVSPSSGPPGGGNTITIGGTNIVNVSSVVVGGVQAPGVFNTLTGQVTAQAPFGVGPGAQDVTVYSQTHGVATCTGCYTYNPNVTITSVTPSSGPYEGGTNVTITGTNLIGVTYLSFGNLATLENMSVLNSTTIVGTTKRSGVAGAHHVYVQTANHGNAMCSLCFTYLPAASPPSANAP